MPRYQEVRLSQLILQLGPGAIVETTGGPRLVPLAQHGLFPQGVDPDRFALDTPHLKTILGDRRVFRVPSNAMLGRPAHRPLYRTRAFPVWKLCVKHSILYPRACPDCEKSGEQSRRIEAIRFVMACPEGHLDEVNWNLLVHSKKPCTEEAAPEYFLWRNQGSSLSATLIRCPRCHQQISLGEAYNRPWPCSGRYPEREQLDSGPQRSGCSQRAWIIQRQATSLRIPELLTFITVPPLETRLHQLLGRPRVRESLESALAMLGRLNRSQQRLEDPAEQEFQQWLGSACPKGPGGLRDDEIEYIQQQDFGAIRSAVRDLLTHHPAPDMQRILLDEFRAFRVGAVQGVPPKVTTGPTGPKPVSLLEINPARVRVVPGARGSIRFRVAPVEKLHSVTVQIGYRRAVGPALEGIPGKFVPIDSSFEGQTWLPGYKAMGEGIFLTADGDGWHPPLRGASAGKWQEGFEEAGRLPDLAGIHPGNHGRNALHPVFVWWHTLSHLLVRALSVESGYSLASIRERIYLEVNEATGQACGGILLYTSGYGSDGTLGGLIALVPRFEHILASAISMGETCSADPLCREHHFILGKHSGAACYACSLISETSCEQRNLWLDRNVLLDNLP
ncbi:DUF1998 domain-containing protein [Meiothermus sp. Pnk-1]|uniref:DUF1998 domain-containing protein n=1 Tax=Meiothermus sp. Pnk-1 TaxID=873128 RepID=UPI000D7C3782|nr:DUF1998 domain-containing protein [Meiothermus sp. Pnk-1]PZA07480.1 hypothetical protein DNA98_07605 [Meiothermus sp. Pnk-1]